MKAVGAIMMKPTNHPRLTTTGVDAGQPLKIVGWTPMPRRLMSRAVPGRVGPRFVGHRSGFTMIEILTVIGIILILIGMLFVGLRFVGNQAKEKSTKITLGNLQSMMSTYDTQGRGMMAKLNQAFYDKASGGTAAPLALPANANVSEAAATSRYAAFVGWTQTPAMSLILSVSENRAAMGKLTTATLKPSGAITAPTNILLDGWSNPIIFVPAAGLDGVTYDSRGGATQTVTSAGVAASGGAIPAGARPFFASAGPDGDFSKGDDNVYSFEP